MRFLHGPEILEAVAEMLQAEKSEIAVAVAFWGFDGPHRLRVESWRAKKVRVICDALSGSCNPEALETLLRSPLELRSHFGLHAKVYWTPTRMVVCSANASSSGLSLASSDPRSNVEAGIETSDPELIRQAIEWFNALYERPETKAVDLAKARVLWASRIPPTRSFSNLINALSDPAAISAANIYAANYDYGGRTRVGDAVAAGLNRKFERGEIAPPVSIERVVQFTKVDTYEDDEDDLPSYPAWNCWIIDLTDDQQLYWYLSDPSRNVRQKNNWLAIPLYGAPKIPIAGSLVPLRRKDLAELKRRWKAIVGPPATGDERWMIPLVELADR